MSYLLLVFWSYNSLWSKKVEKGRTKESVNGIERKIRSFRIKKKKCYLLLSKKKNLKVKIKKNWGCQLGEKKLKKKLFFLFKGNAHFIFLLIRNNYFLILIDSFQKQHPGKQPGEFDSMVSPSYSSFIFKNSGNWM